MLGYSIEELRETNVAALFHADDAAGMWELYQELTEGKHDAARVEKRYYRKDGSVVWTDLAVSLIRHHDGRPRFTVAMIEDITERHQLQQRLRFQALHDPLTGLPNRTLFFDRLDAVLDAAGRPGEGRGLLPRPGRLQGDQRHPRPRPRRPAAAWCRPDGWPRAWPASGHLVARMGGDEFVILVDASDGIDDASRVARGRAGRGRRPGRTSVTPVRRLGQCRHRQCPAGGDHRLRADEGRRHHAVLGQGRRAGPVGAVSTPSAAPGDIARSALAAGLPAALDRGEFVVHYQPIVSLLDGTMLGGGGAGSVAAPGAGPARAGPVHRPGRGDRPDRPARRVGAAAGLPATPQSVAARPTRAPSWW